jgi:hypothetical protein
MRAHIQVVGAVRVDVFTYAKSNGVAALMDDPQAFTMVYAAHLSACVFFFFFFFFFYEPNWLVVTANS